MKLRLVEASTTAGGAYIAVHVCASPDSDRGAYMKTDVCATRMNKLRWLTQSEALRPEEKVEPPHTLRNAELLSALARVGAGTSYDLEFFGPAGAGLPAMAGCSAR